METQKDSFKKRKRGRETCGQKYGERGRGGDSKRQRDRDREREREKEREIILARWRKRGEGGDERLVFTNGESSHEHRRRHACVF